MLLGVGREDIFKPIIDNESLHEIGNYNGARLTNFATSKNLLGTYFSYPSLLRFRGHFHLTATGKPLAVRMSQSVLPTMTLITAFKFIDD
jgi:hypothetical protein